MSRTDADDVVEVEGAEHDLTAGDWWDVGYSDGLMNRRDWPPQDKELAASYAEGRAAGIKERVEEEERALFAPRTNAIDTDEIPF